MSELEPGWYDVPGQPGMQHYWDGTQVVAQRQNPAAGAPSSPSAEAQTAPQPAQPPPGYPSPPVPQQIPAQPGQPLPGYPYPPVPPKKGLSTGAIVGIVLGCVAAGFLVLLLLIGFGVFAAGNSTDRAQISACETERSSLLTAWWAADTANQVSGFDESWRDYLEAPLVYFGEPTESGADRIKTDAVSADDCAAISADELTDF